MLKVKFATSHLSLMHSARGVGRYTQQLQSALLATGQVDILAAHNKAKPDLTHYPYFDFYFSTLPFNLFSKSVVTIHDTIPLVFPDKYPSGKKGRLNFLKQKMALRMANVIITDSLHSKKDIEIYLGIPKDKIFVVPLAPPEKICKVDEKTLRLYKKKFNLPANYCLYVGDINYNKNLPQLIKALKYLPWNIKLLLVGKNFVKQDIPEWHAIENQIALSDVARQVQFLTTVYVDDFTALSAIYSGAICYLQPSLYEGFGLPVLEAMSCQTPVICTKISSLEEVAGQSAVFAESSAESLSQAVSYVLSLSSTARKILTDRAYEWSKKFSWEKTAKKTLTVYKYVLEM